MLDNKLSGIPQSFILENKEDLEAKGFVWDKDTFSFEEDKAMELLDKLYKDKLKEVYEALYYCINEIDAIKECYIPNPKYNPNQKAPFYFSPLNKEGYSTIVLNEDYGEKKLDSTLHEQKIARVQRALTWMGRNWLNFWD